MGQLVGGLVRQLVRRTSKGGLKVRCESPPRWLVRTKRDEGFESVEELEMLRLLLRKFIRYSPERLTFRVDVLRLSWLESEGRVRSEKNTFVFDVTEKGRVDRHYKVIPLTQTWMDDPTEVARAAEDVAAVVFEAIEDVVRMAWGPRR